MVSAIASASAQSSALFNPSALLSANSPATDAANPNDDQTTLLESRLALYTKQLAESVAGPNGQGAANAQQIQLQILAIQQQLAQLGAAPAAQASSAAVPAASASTASASNSSIDVFA